jgi:hypothetical protein
MILIVDDHLDTCHPLAALLSLSGAGDETAPPPPARGARRPLI